MTEVTKMPGFADEGGTPTRSSTQQHCSSTVQGSKISCSLHGRRHQDSKRPGFLSLGQSETYELHMT